MTSLYRKYRSRSFDDLVGQDHVVQTLRNAVRLGRVGHAYLFTGPRGTGKTSMARILAKAVNCLSPVDGNPDNICQNCTAANQGRAMDVIEIDAASNTGVDSVRDLRERVGYASSEGLFKVYIVDEVHRLSGQAFDAFLKTLEEPPPHVIFVFASTEPHKVPETITSRCQRFDFRRISHEETCRRLKHVADSENIDVDADALDLVAQNAGGSLRDALGLLDQVSSFTSAPIHAVEVRAALGLADPLLIGRLSDYLLEQDVGSGLDVFHAFSEGGGDPGQLSMQFVDYWRVLLLKVSGARITGMNVDPALMQYVDNQSSRLTSEQTIALIRVMIDHDFSARFNVPPELSFEMRYVRASLGLMPSVPESPVSVKTPGRVAPDTSTARSTNAVRPAQAARDTPPLREAEVPEVPVQAPPEPTSRDVSVSSNQGAGPDNQAVADAWDAIVQRMRGRSGSVQAVLRSGFPLQAEQGELVIGFEYDFHFNYFADVKKRKLVEEVIEEVLGATYRVRCIRTSKEEVEKLRAARGIPEDDGFIEEAAERLRAFHARELGKGHS
ncbi:MAG: DNA polymerase III subunit gamma/tau [Chloroflexota bacterium]